MFPAVSRPICVLTVLVVSCSGRWMVVGAAKSGTRFLHDPARSRLRVVRRPAGEAGTGLGSKTRRTLDKSSWPSVLGVPIRGQPLQELRHIAGIESLAARRSARRGRQSQARSRLRCPLAAQGPGGGVPDDAGVHQALAEIAFRAGDYGQRSAKHRPPGALAPASTDPLPPDRRLPG